MARLQASTQNRQSGGLTEPDTHKQRYPEVRGRRSDPRAPDVRGILGFKAGTTNASYAGIHALAFYSVGVLVAGLIASPDNDVDTLVRGEARRLELGGTRRARPAWL